MFLRFQTKSPDPRSGRPTDILVAAHELRDCGKLASDQEQWLRDSLSYFEMHLKVPTAPKDPKHRRGVSWFRSHSSMVNRIRELMGFMEANGVSIDIIETDNPGILYYQDAHQVAAWHPPAGARPPLHREKRPDHIPSILTIRKLKTGKDRPPGGPPQGQ